MHKLILPLLLFCLVLGLGSSHGTASEGPIVYLPFVQKPGNLWLGPDGGRAVCLAVNPADPTIMYAGSWGTGMYKSVDSGLSWFQINNGLGNLYINSLAIDPKQPAVLYAGTYHSQVYKSIDGGNSWVWSGTGIQAEAIVYTIAIDPVNTAYIYIGTRGISNNGLPPWKGVVYKSTNAGASWAALPEMQNIGGVGVQDWVYSLAVNPADHDNVVAATHEYGGYRTNDYGVNWFTINDGITDLSGRSILVEWLDGDPYTLYMGVWHGAGVFRSENYGGEWYLTNKSITGIAIYSMIMDPVDHRVIYLSSFTHGVVRTANRGDDWVLRGLRDDGIYGVAINPKLTSTIYAATAGDGIYRSPDKGLTWAHSQAGFRNADISSVVAPGTPEQLFTALFGGGVRSSTDGGATWQVLNSGLTDKYVLQLVADPSQPNIMYALTQTDGLFRYDTLSSTSWVPVGEALPLSTSSLPAFNADDPRASRETLLDEMNPTASPEGVLVSEDLLSMVFAPSNPSIVYLGTGGSGVYKSLNGGIDWLFSGLAGLTVRSIAVDPLNPDTVYAVTDASGFVQVSYDGGAIWGPLAVVAPSAYSVVVASDGSGIVYLGTGQGVYSYSSSTGWISAGLSELAVTILSTDPHHPGAVFAGTNDGAYFTSDGGAIWQNGPPDLDGLTVKSITYNPLNPNLFYFGTQIQGILQANLYLTGE